MIFESNDPPHGLNITSFFNLKLARTVENVREAIGVDHYTMSNILAMTLDDYQLARICKKDFPVDSLIGLCEEVDLSINLLFSGKIDFAALRKSYFSDKVVWPEQYADPSHFLARSRGVQSVLKFMSRTYTPEFCKMILRRLQLKSFYFQDQEQFLSPQIGADLVFELSKEGATEGDFRSMGEASFELLKNSGLGKVLSGAKSPRALFGLAQDNGMSWFDRFFEYRIIQLREDGCIMTSTPQEMSFDLFHSKDLGNKQMCYFKQGVFRSIIGCVGYDFAELRESECFYEGASHCVYHLSWGAPMHGFKKLLVTRQDGCSERECSDPTLSEYSDDLNFPQGMQVPRQRSYLLAQS